MVSLRCSIAGGGGGDRGENGDGDGGEDRGLNLNLSNKRLLRLEVGEDSAAGCDPCSPEDCSGCGSELDCPLEGSLGGPLAILGPGAEPKALRRYLEPFDFFRSPMCDSEVEILLR